MLQVANDKILLIDDILYDITNGDNTYNLIVFKYGKMADPFIAHQLHALLNSRVGRNIYRTLSHDIPNQGFLGSTPFKDHFSGIVSFSKNPDKFAIFNHYQCTHIHFLEGF